MKLKIICFVIWVVFFMYMLTATCDLMTEHSTFANIIGFIGLVCTVILTISTKCFTSINLKKNKSNEK